MEISILQIKLLNTESNAPIEQAFSVLTNTKIGALSNKIIY
jgi:hypothetical protein